MVLQITLLELEKTTEIGATSLSVRIFWLLWLKQPQCNGAGWQQAATTAPGIAGAAIEWSENSKWHFICIPKRKRRGKVEKIAKSIDKYKNCVLLELFNS